MNKTAIRNFAIWARNKLIAEVSYRAGLMGITKDGIADALPQSTSDVEFYDIGTSEPYSIHNGEIKQRKSLVELVRQKEKDSDYITAYISIIEEVAYTWFNRMIAVRFMEVNDYMPAHIRVLSSETGKLEPDIVTTPFDAELELTDTEKQQIIQLKNENKLDDCFRILFIKQCNALHELLPRLFENTKDYTELLLNVSFVDQEGVVYHLVHDIEEDDFNIEKGGQVEIIGWLYQYYNSELKDETFALLKNNVKVSKERIPSATQLFTPDWIVRYMVENSLGRLWIEGHPNEVLKTGWKYYLDEVDQEESVKRELEKINAEFSKLNPEDIKVIDPCMGSGHILVYAFEVLMQIYISAGYSERDAARSILENNIFGLDIDDRAAQLAYFAVMMKARQYNRRILDGKCDCNVYAIKESNGFNRDSLVKIGDDVRPVAEKILNRFVDAKEYGSILSLDVSIDELNMLENRLEDIGRSAEYGNLIDMLYADILCTELNMFTKITRVMIQKYDAVITNPPYMGNGGMDVKLSNYIKTMYPAEKADLFACFINKGNNMVKNNGYNCMVTMQSWMFLSSFESMRKEILSQKTITCLLHMENMVMGIAFGTAVCVLKNVRLEKYKGRYNFVTLKDIVDSQPIRFPLENSRDSSINVECFHMIPGAPIAYWLSDKWFKLFEESPKIAEIAKPRVGQNTGDNERFLKLWFEVCKQKIGIGVKHEDIDESDYKWIPYSKGGSFRRWYGNYYYIINWKNNGQEIKEYAVIRNKGKHWSRYIQNLDYLCVEGVTWSDLSSGKFACRYLPEGFICDVKGSSAYPQKNVLLSYLAFLNSNITYEGLKVLAPTISFQTGDIGRLPFCVEPTDYAKLDMITKEQVEISKIDWDSFETSWGFKKHPLV